jgi:anaerobic magnesium-protoporphyrin IX monomethyl ester cyclase
MRVLLINPPFDLPKHLVNEPNTGLAYLAAYLYQQGHELSCLEMNLFRGDEEVQLRRAVASFQPQAVGFSIMGPQTLEAVRLVRILRQVYAGPVIFGGPNATCMGESLLEKYPEIDISVYSEGESTAAELLQALEQNSDLERVLGIIYRRQESIKRTPPRPLVKDLDSLPWPFYDLFGFEQLSRYPLMTSRGCPFNCIFCYKTFGKAVRFRQVTDCVDELVWATKHYHTSQFRIVDDSFNLIPERAEEFCDLLLERKLDLNWSLFGVRADRITSTLARKMRASGCFSASVGLESLDPEVFPEIQKGETMEDLELGTRLLKEAGIHVTGYLIVGLPKDNFRKTLSSFHKAWTLVDRVGMTIATPIPGTALYNWVQQESRLLADLEQFSAKGFLVQVPYDTPEFTAAERLRAFRMTAILSNIPAMPASGPKLIRYLGFALHLIWRMVRWNMLVLYYDGRNYGKHVSYIFRRIRDMVKSRQHVHYDRYVWRRIPDGTWSLAKGDPSHR